jgi:hypothetical protein
MKLTSALSLMLLSLLTACTTSRFETSKADIPLERPATPTSPPSIYQTNPKADLEDAPARPTTPINPINPIRGEPLPDTPTPLTPVKPIKPPTQVAAIDPTAPVVPMPPRPNLGPIGTWSVSDADSKCRITLSSQVTLDRSRASSNCKSPSLAKVNYWERRGNEVVLYEGEKVTARLFDKGNGQYEGSTARGAPVTMSR